MNAPHALTAAEAAAIALAAGHMEAEGDALVASGRRAAAEAAYRRADEMSGIYRRWAFGRREVVSA